MPCAVAYSFAMVGHLRQTVRHMSRRPKGVPMIHSFHEQGSMTMLLGRALGSVPIGT